MDHLREYQSRRVMPLTTATQSGWKLKRYAILAKGREYDAATVAAASAEAFRRLPEAGALRHGAGNHGIGFQIIHFAEVAVVSPTFYWQWGSVLAKSDQIRAQWEAPCDFHDGAADVLGCVWEMDIVNFEVAAWKASLLTNQGDPAERLARYLEQHGT